jgi:hypothetical protein
MSGDGGLYQCKGIEYPHCVFMTTLGIEDLAEYFHRAWMMVVPIEDLEALRLRGCELASSQILPCQRYQHFGVALQG